MKKNVLAWGAAVALAGLAGLAGAVNAQTTTSGQKAFLTEETTAEELVVNPDGIGHIQLVPYFSSQGNRNTLLNIINTDAQNGKVVKVRFRGARNSDDVFDFYVLLSPGDVWRSRVYRDGEQTKLESNDNSCTWPLNFAANGGTAFPTTRVFQNLESEVREGYIEILTAANVPEFRTYRRPDATADSPTDFVTEPNPLYTAIKHVNGVAPCTEAVIDNALQPLTEYNVARFAGLDNPTSALIAQWAISDVSTLATTSGLATTLEARDDKGQAAKANIVVSAQTDDAAPPAWHSPRVADLESRGTADPLLLAWNSTSYFDYPDLSTPYLRGHNADKQANTISGALAVTRVINEFASVDAELQTDWVLSMPTRRYGVAIDYLNNGIVHNTTNNYFSIDNVTFTDTAGVPALSINLQAEYWDDEENKVSGNVVISPGTPVNVSLRGEVSVFSFNQAPEESLLGAQIAAQRINPVFNSQQVKAGWASFGLTARPGVNNSVIAGDAIGLPVIGYASIGSKGNSMSFTWPHRYKRGVAEADGGGSGSGGSNGDGSGGSNGDGGGNGEAPQP